MTSLLGVSIIDYVFYFFLLLFVAAKSKHLFRRVNAETKLALAMLNQEKVNKVKNSFAAVQIYAKFRTILLNKTKLAALKQWFYS